MSEESKPREFWIHIPPGKIKFAHAMFEKGLDSDIHVIEKSAADKLAEALDDIIILHGHESTDTTCCEMSAIAEQALKEYRGKDD